jgi:DNA-binding MarR family transcriptional regulator
MTKPKNIEVELLERVWCVADATSTHCNAVLRDLMELSLAHFFVLRVLLHAGRTLGTTDIARALGCSKPNASTLVARLEQLGCMVKRRHPRDTRAVSVGLSLRGVEDYNAGTDQLADEAARVFAALDADEKTQLLALLDKIRFPKRARALTRTQGPSLV